MSKSFMRSREEDQELQMSTKKVKESHHGKSIRSHSMRVGLYHTKKQLLGSFDFNNMMEYEAISDDDFEGLPLRPTL